MCATSRGRLKGRGSALGFPSYFVDTWDVNLMAGVSSAILDPEVGLGMESDQSENTDLSDISQP